MNRINFQKCPPKWAEDPLSSFLNLSFQNVFASFAKLPDKYGLLAVVHEAYEKSTNPRPHVLPYLQYVFLLMSHSSFLGSVQLALCGLTSESYSLMRNSLESSLYSLYTFNDDKKKEIWINRDNDETSNKECRNTFTIKNIFKALKERDTDLHDKSKSLYDEMIKHGAHPNILSATQRIVGSSNAPSFNYFDVNTDSHELCLKSCAQIGRSCLHIFELLHPDEFKKLGISSMLSSVKV